MKKGAYDLGRKALYYIIALMIIAVIFIYISNALYKYQITGFENLNKIKEPAIINKVNSCFYYEDKEIERIYANTVDMEKFNQATLEKCLGEQLGACSDTPMTITLKRLEPNGPVTSLSHKADMLRDKQTIRRLVTVKDKGYDYEGLLQLEIPK
jgi:hypothetical protein